MSSGYIIGSNNTRGSVRLTSASRRQSLLNETYISIKDYTIDIACIVLSRIMLDCVYILYIVPFHSYASHFRYYPDYLNYAISWIALIAAAPLALNYRRSKQNTLSDVFIACLFFLAYLPGTVVIAYQGVSTSFITCYLCYWLFVFCLARVFPKIRINRPLERYRSIVLKVMVVFFALGVIYISWRYTGFRIHLSLDDVYELRTEAHAYNWPTIFSYILNAAVTIIPIIAIYALYKRNNWLFVSLCLIQLLAFSIDGLKSTIIALVVGIIGYFFFKRLNISAFVRILSCLVVFGVGLWFVGHDYIVNLLVRRTMLVPAVLNVHYFDFFSSNPLDYFRQSVFSKIGFQSDYSQGFGYVIGQQVLNSETNANNGLFSDAYANLGAAGCVLMPFLVIALIRVIEACSEGLPIPIMIIVVVVGVYTLISSLFFTALLTHGIAFLCLCLYLLPRDFESQ